ncbi:hypothetical protein JV483_003254 [Escherichia coli]|nr:hypothetical protein [Escherichia coli]
MSHSHCFGFKLSNCDKKFIITLALLMLVYILPIILADRLYIDDILRSQQGYKNWGINGRPLADILMAYFNFTEGVIADSSPLTLLFSSIIFLLCSFFYYRKNLSSYGFMFGALAMFMVFANPFMLENLSYKFDVLPMLTSISVLLIPYSVDRSKVYAFLAGILCIVSSLSLYQASIGFFCTLALVEIITTYRNRSYSAIGYITAIIIRVTQLIIGYAIYSKISSYFISGEYNIEHSQIVSLDRSGISLIYSNASTYFDKIHQAINETTSVAYLIVAISMMCCIFISLSRRDKVPGNIYSRASLALCLILSPVLALAFSFIHLSILKYPVFADRVLISFGGALLFYSISMATLVKCKSLASMLMIPVVFFSMYYSYVYGNAMKYQRQYDDRLSHEIATFISNADTTGSLPVYTYGSQPSSIQRSNAVNRFPSLGTLVPLYYVDGWWGTLLINMYGIRNKVSGLYDVKQVCSMSVVYKNQSYSIYKDASKIIVDFSKYNCK